MPHLSHTAPRPIISVKFSMAQAGQSVLTTKKGSFAKGSIGAAYSVSIGAEGTDLGMDLQGAGTGCRI